MTSSTSRTKATTSEPKGTAMNRTRGLRVAATLLLTAASVGLAACGPEFDPPSLISSTRVVGARISVDGDPERATPAPGESATVTWLVTAPGPTPPLDWAFALCAPAPGGLGCAGAPLATSEGNTNPPSVRLTLPQADVLGSNTRLALYGRICAGGTPTVDPQTSLPGCTNGAPGTSVSFAFPLQGAQSSNRNPVADRGLTFDGQPWPPLPAGADPCMVGPRVKAGMEELPLTFATAGSDREAYSTLIGDPPAPTAAREPLQISNFATSGEFKSPYAFVEGDDPNESAVASAAWSAPPAAEITADTPVVFTFVVRDGRGGMDWTTRAACVTP